MFGYFLKSFVLCALFCVCLYSGEAYAVVDRCPRHQIGTNLDAKLMKTRKLRGSINTINTYLHNHDRSQGTVLAFVKYGGKALSVKTSYKFTTKNIGGGKYCVMLEAVNANFYAAPSIVMPSNFKKGSCEYKLILKHEQRHLDALYNFHRVNTGKYAAYLGKIARAIPIHAPVKTQADANKVQREISDYFAEKFYTLVNQSLRELGRKQSVIDSPQEYRGVGKRLDNCSKSAKK